MHKFMSIFKYQLTSSFKTISIFYISFYSTLAFLLLIFPDLMFGGLDILTVLLISFLFIGIVSDFRTFLQNGFTRKYFHLSSLSLFAVVSIFLSIVETIIYNIFHNFSSQYESLYTLTYGYDGTLVYILTLLLSYMLIFSVIYFAVILWYKIGGRKFTYILLAFVVAIVLVNALYSSNPTVGNAIRTFLHWAIGITSSGDISHLVPLSIITILIGIFASISYLIIRRLDLK